MENTVLQDLMVLKEINKDDKHTGKWSMATAIWVIAAILFVLALLWFIHRTGQDKADLAGAIQGLYGKVNSLEPAVTAQGNNLYNINSVLSATTQGVGDLKNTVLEQLATLNGAVYAPRCGSSRCGNNGSRFVKTDNYSLCDSSLQSIESCG